MASPQDIVLAILGASGGFAGLLLVFSGLVFTQAASFPVETENKIIDKVRRAARLAIYPFWGFLATTILCTVWLLHHSHLLFVSAVSLFFALVIGTGIYGTTMCYRYL